MNLTIPEADLKALYLQLRISKIVTFLTVLSVCLFVIYLLLTPLLFLLMALVMRGTV